MFSRGEMRGLVTTALVGTLVSAVLAVVALSTFVAFRAPAGLPGAIADAGWTARSRAWFTVRGLYAAEVGEDGHHYTWTSPAVRVVIPHLDRSEPLTLTLTVSAHRPDGMALPTLSWTVDGVAAGARPISNVFEPITISIPARQVDRAVVTMQIANPWDPGPDDDRQLGVFVRDVALSRASGRVSPRADVLVSLAISVVLIVLPLWLSRLPPTLAAAASAGLAVACAWLMALDGAYLGPFPDALRDTALVACIPTLAVAVVGLRRNSGESSWPAVVTVVLATSSVKLAIFAHPLAIIGDGIFQVHRAQLVSAGQYFFTSITPRPFFEFPYAIALYVAAMPFWDWVPREIDRVWLLRVVALSADALAGIALALVARRAWASSRAGLFVAVLWLFARAPFEALSNANLTNAFGQSVFALALAGLALSAQLTRFAWVTAGVSGAALVVAFLSHFSTLSVGVPLVGLVTIALVLFGQNVGRRGALRIAVVLVAALAVSYALYYRHFGEVYQKTIERVTTEQPVDATRSSIAASPLVKLQRWATVGSDDYGLPGMVLAVAAMIGAFVVLRTRPREPWTLILIGWLAVWVGFTALGILSSVQMRVNLAAAPVFVCLGAYALDRIGRRSTPFQWLAGFVAAVVVWDGLRLWRICLGQ